MKIGIISINMFSKGLNFACPLHTYAFQQFLLKNGIESTVITYKPIYDNGFDMRHPYDYYVNRCNDYINSGKDIKDPEEWERIKSLRDAWGALYQEREIRYDKFQNFIDSNYIKTEECYNSDLLEITDPGFDCYICCTDVIWKNNPGDGFDRGFFLASKAMENKWKISYAASRGPFLGLTEDEERTFLYYVQDIDAISVREESLKDYLSESLSNDVTLVLDPVLLHEKEFYEEILVKPKEEKYLLLYYVMEKAKDTIEYAVRYARQHNLKIIEITDHPLKDGRLTEYTDVEVLYKYDIGVEEWLGYIKNADCVFTNSFHCSCFSILFEKQFFVGFRHGDKVAHVLDTFGLSERIIDKENDFSRSSQPDIDYSKVKPIMEEKRRESSEFILSAIRFAENNERPVKNYDWWKRAIRYRMISNSGKYEDIKIGAYDPEDGKLKKLSADLWEFESVKPTVNDGFSRFKKNPFCREGYIPDGWQLRFRIDKKWFWYLEDGSYVLKSKYNSEKYPPIRKFKDNDRIPYIPVTGISIAVAEAFWKKGYLNNIDVIYNGGLKSKYLDCRYDKEKGEIKRLSSGALEYRITEKLTNNGQTMLIKNEFECPEYDFLGWKMRIRDNGKWYWYLEDGSLKLKGRYNAKRDGERYLLKDGANIPYIPSNNIDTVVFEGVWESSNILIYNGGLKSKDLTCRYDEEKGEINRFGTGSLEYRLNEKFTNNGETKLVKNKFECSGYDFLGWKMRIKEGHNWYWYLEDGTLKLKNQYNAKNDGERFLLEDGANIPYIPLNHIDTVVLEAVWQKQFTLIYNGGLKLDALTCRYDEEKGEIMRLGSGSLEYRMNETFTNDGQTKLIENKFEYPEYDFFGWKMRVRDGDKWYWYLEDGSLKLINQYNAENDGERFLLEDGANIPYLPAKNIDTVVLEALWQKRFTLIYNGGLKLDALVCRYDEEKGEIKRLNSGSLEYRMNEKLTNNGQMTLVENKFECLGYDFLGWKMRVRAGGKWYWYLKNGTLRLMNQYNAENDGEKCLLQDGANIPYIPSNNADMVVLEAVWEKQFTLIYNGGIKSKDLTCCYDEEKGEINRLSSGSLEYKLNEKFTNNGRAKLIKNAFKCPGYEFLGWRMRVKDGRKWYWYLESGEFKLTSQYSAETDGEKDLLADGSHIPYIQLKPVDKIVLEGVWKAKFKTRLGRWIYKIIDR